MVFRMVYEPVVRNLHTWSPIPSWKVNRKESRVNPHSIVFPLINPLNLYTEDLTQLFGDPMHRLLDYLRSFAGTYVSGSYLVF